MTVFNLEERTLKFSKEIRSFIKIIPKTIYNVDDFKQLIRSSGSIGANYIEANESLSKKDFIMRIKISKKEARESLYWLKIIKTDQKSNSLKNELIKEVSEIINILGAILAKTVNRQ
jgi:four helix bundle protein